MKFESWQFFHVARKKLQQGDLQRIYRRSSRLTHYWAADPRYCEDSKRNPLDRIRTMIEKLDLAGAGDYARAAIDYLSEPLGGRFCDSATAKSDKGTIDGEVADITIAVGDLANQIRDALADDHIDSEERIEIIDAARTLTIEIEQLLDAAGV